MWTLLLLLACASGDPPDPAGVPPDTGAPALSDEPGADDTAPPVDTAPGGADTDPSGGHTGDTGVHTGSADTAAAPQTYPDLPTAGCGAPGYSWLPLEGMGAILAAEEAPELSLSAEAIDLAMALYGLEDYSPVPFGVKVWRVRYLTQDRGEAAEATALVSVPDLTEAAEVPALLFLHPTTGFTGECAPTATGLEGGAFNVLFSSLGVAVVTPDYLGMNGWGEPSELLHPYAVAEPTAVASLDALRALHRFADEQALAARPDPEDTLLLGTSEGGFAALWADRYAPRYAPEFGLVGVAVSVPPVDLVGIAALAAEELSDTTWALAAAVAVGNPWYGEAAPLSDFLTDEAPHHFASTLVGAVTAECFTYGQSEAISEVDELLVGEVAAALLTGEPAEPFSCYLEESSLQSARVPLESDTPVLIATAERDLVVRSEPTRAIIPELCAQGYVIEHMECDNIGHIAGALDPIPALWRWLLERQAGAALGETCVIHEPVECPDLY